ncbi:MAG: NUDIX domain-containing protein [Candidatus Saccharimonadales bacterium]
MRELEIAIGLIEQDDEYVLQRRDNRSRIGAAGLIGCFGGQIKTKPDDTLAETPAEAVARELAEETNLVTAPEQWERLGHVSVTSDRDHETVKIEAEIFRYRLETGFVMVASDGQVIRIKQRAVHEKTPELASATKAVFEELIRS